MLNSGAYLDTLRRIRAQLFEDWFSCGLTLRPGLSLFSFSLTTGVLEFQLLATASRVSHGFKWSYSSGQDSGNHLYLLIQNLGPRLVIFQLFISIGTWKVGEEGWKSKDNLWSSLSLPLPSFQGSNSDCQAWTASTSTDWATFLARVFDLKSISTFEWKWGHDHSEFLVDGRGFIVDMRVRTSRGIWKGPNL